MRVLVLLLLLSPLASAGLISHFTAAEGGFTSELILRNASKNGETVSFKYYAANRSSSLSIVLEPGATQIIDGRYFSFWPTHLSYECSELVSVSARYRVTEGGNAVTVGSNQEASRVFRYGYLDPTDFWSGLAIVSQEADTQVVFRQIDANGVVLFERELSAAMGAFNRDLVDVSGLPLTANSSSYYEIVASKPIVATMLFGTRGGVPIMSLAVPEKSFNDRIVARYSGGVAGLFQEIVITPTTLSVGGQAYAIHNYDAIRTELLNDGAADLVVNVLHNPCCDQFDFHLEFIDGLRRNHFSVTSFDLDGRNVGALEAYALVERVFNIARQVSGVDIPLPR